MQLKTEHSWKHWLALVVILLSAVFMEAIMGFQYRFARQQLEAELERSTLMDLNTSALYIQEVLSNAEVAVRNEVVHAERQIHDRSYLNEIIRTMVANDRKNLDGAFLCFEPNFYPDKGQWYELYARQNGPSIEVIQIGSARHDYTSREYYRSAIEEGSSQWTDPYWDEDGAGAWVLTYAQPLSYQGRRIGVLGVDLTTTWINDVVNHYHPHPSSFCMVLTEDGKLIAAPSDTAVVTPTMLLKLVDMFNDSTVERTLVGKGRITRFTFLDDECGERGRVYYARKARSPYWQMLLVCYDSEVFGELDKLRGYMLLLAIIGLAILTVIVLLFLRASKKLQVSQLSQERIGAELHVANEIQQSMLPHHKLRLEDVDIYGRLVPAREVGGDLYDYFVRDEKLFFCIGDVSGKGAPAAMLMAVTHSLFRSASAHENNPARIMQALNEFSATNNEKNMFVTLFIGVLDLPTGLLRYANAGHDNPFFIHDKMVEMLDCDANLPVGVFTDTKFTLQKATIPAGSILFLYTDGLTEAKNAKHELFGLQRVEQVMNTCMAKALPPKQLIDTMTDSMHAFVQKAEQSDDLTMLAIHYSPSRFVSTLTQTLTLKNDVHEVRRFSDFIKDVTEKLHIEPTLAGQLRLAIEEAVVNVIDYAYPLGTEGEIDILVQSDGQILRVIISDRGVAFDPTTKEKADTSLSAEDRQIGGLGILLVRELMDTINYERTDGKNILTLIKKIA